MTFKQQKQEITPEGLGLDISWLKGKGEPLATRWSLLSPEIP